MIDLEASDRLTCALIAKPRILLAQLPTPLQEAPRLSERLGVRVLIKRDDQTGLTLGGNKARKLEFLIGDAVARGADVIVTTGGAQSNHARLTAGACRVAGLECRLVLNRGPHNEVQGNLLLDYLLGAQVEWVESENPQDAIGPMEAVADQLRTEGRTPYLIPRGGSIPEGATGYAAMVPELLSQVEALGVLPTHLYLATGSTGTHSGTLAGMVAAGVEVRIQGISVSRPREQQEARVLELANATLEHLGLAPDASPDRIHVDDGFVGRGYGYPTEGTMEAIETLARDEAIILDPVYTGKAMNGLLAHAREGRFDPDDVVVFLHTGGAPALFAYDRETALAVGAPQA
jgi:D-cysteine desulfhydrase family pyridoxal phosphate-dependent enzyme